MIKAIKWLNVSKSPVKQKMFPFYLLHCEPTHMMSFLDWLEKETFIFNTHFEQMFACITGPSTFNSKQHFSLNIRSNTLNYLQAVFLEACCVIIDSCLKPGCHTGYVQFVLCAVGWSWMYAFLMESWDRFFFRTSLFTYLPCQVWVFNLLSWFSVIIDFIRVKGSYLFELESW